MFPEWIPKRIPRPVSPSSKRCAKGLVGVILRWTMQRNTSWRITPGSLEYPLVIAHRGGSGMAPENTMAAFHKAMEVGADAIELDVRLTRDGRVMVIHDRRVDRTTTGMGPVGTYTLGELKSLDAGSWYGSQFEGERLPTLEEVFEVLPDEFPIYVELKARGPGAWPLVRAVVKLIRDHERYVSTMVASFNPIALVFLRAIEPRIIRGYIWSAGHPLPMRARWLNPLVDPHWLAPGRHTLTRKIVSRFHAQGKPVAAWDLDAGDDMEELKKMGLDAVVTDHPAVLVRQKFGMIKEE